LVTLGAMDFLLGYLRGREEKPGEGLSSERRRQVPGQRVFWGAG
jgi:hypothetical protein